ncbi:MAG: LodA/GoxA family CTQ-dependent oxidase [Spirochaetota bacterium]
MQDKPVRDTEIIRAVIHPGIGVARVGNAETEYYIGPEVTNPVTKENGFYRTSDGTLKREAARFRIYGYNANGEVVAELTSANADINWTVHVANRKADWFHFITAMDIPESKDLVVKRRNPGIKLEDRSTLVIDPGARSIAGKATSGTAYRFDSGSFKGEKVYLGELQTDEEGRLLFLGGHGKSVSLSGQPPFIASDPDSFNNAPDWYDDISDGPVHAEVSISGKKIPVEGAWVISAPPNYAPNIIGWRTMYDLMVDVYTQNGWLPVPETTSFHKDILPQLYRLSNLQWVNKGFAAMFGKDCPMDFSNPKFIARLAEKPENTKNDPYGELRRLIFNSFRPYQPAVNEPRLWPWIYGDDYGGDLFQNAPNTMLALPSLQQLHLQRWVDGNFVNDWQPDKKLPQQLTEVPLAEQPAMLDQAAMHFCLADAFHPGCEMTWPMRHPSMYSKPFRIRESKQQENADKWGKSLNQSQVLALNGPLYGQVAGGITRWMGLPWQGDTAYCRSGYDLEYDPYVPTFWPARVPNSILTEDDYKIVIDTTLPHAERIAAYNRRRSWNRFIDDVKVEKPSEKTAKVMEKMIAHFSAQGIIEARPGFKNDADFPEVIYVENKAFQEVTDKLLLLAVELEPGTRAAKLQESGWDSEEHLQSAIRLRQRRPMQE